MYTLQSELKRDTRGEGEERAFQLKRIVVVVKGWSERRDSRSQLKESENRDDMPVVEIGKCNAW